jgi:hypothetical protein
MLRMARPNRCCRPEFHATFTSGFWYGLASGSNVNLKLSGYPDKDSLIHKGRVDQWMPVGQTSTWSCPGTSKKCEVGRTWLMFKHGSLPHHDRHWQSGRRTGITILVSWSQVLHIETDPAYFTYSYSFSYSKSTNRDHCYEKRRWILRLDCHWIWRAGDTSSANRGAIISDFIF